MDGYATSDAELDSELESDSESELGVWLDQLNQYTKVSDYTILMYFGLGDLQFLQISRACKPIYG